MSDIRNIPVWQLREAAAAWRAHTVRRSGWFGPPSGNPSTFDRIDEMIDEIERLRAPTGKGADDGTAG